MANNYLIQNPNSIWIEELGNRKLRFHYLNGDIDFDESKFGAYVMATGCGSGKTTNIRNLIGMRWYEGILYTAFTIGEVNEMYKWIVDNLVGKALDPNTGGVLKLEDIVVLHSDIRSDGVDMNLFRNHPELLADKRIILCTHYKLLNEPFSVLAATKFNTRLANEVEPDINNVVKGITSYPRQWILIDESTEANGKSYTIPISTFATLGEITRIERVSNGYTHKTISLKEPKLVRRYNFYSDFRDLVLDASIICNKSIVSIDPVDELSRIKFNQVVSDLYNKFEYYHEKCKNSKSKTVKIQYNYTSAIMDEMKTKLILFDGTGDIMLRNSRKFDVLKPRKKYNCSLNISIFKFGLIRRLSSYKFDSNKLNEYITSELDKAISDLANIIMSNKKTLIFTWMNFKKGDEEVVNDDNVIDRVDNSSVSFTDLSVRPNPNFDLPNYIRFELYRRGFTDNQFAIEYYGSGKDKATNEFRDFDSVVLLGKYQVPNYVIDDFNTVFDTNVTDLEYYANRVVQAICRTRIRLHQRLPINVYFSSDWNTSIINYVADYISTDNTELKSNKLLDSPVMNSDVLTRLREIGITPKKSEKIAKLCEYDEGILSAIENKLEYTLNITLDKIYELIPMSMKKSKEYSSILKSLERLGVTINIV